MRQAPTDSVEAAIEAFLCSAEGQAQLATVGDEMEGWEEDEGWGEGKEDADEDVDEEGEEMAMDEHALAELFELRCRLELEEEKTYPAKARLEQAFLGLGEPLPVNEDSQSAAAAAAAVSAAGPGVVRLRGALKDDLAVELREFVLAQLRDVRGRRQAERAVQLGLMVEERLSNVLAADQRWDLRLPMRSVVRRAMAELLGDGSPLGDALHLVTGGDEAELWELSAMVSAPGALSQVVHADCDGAPAPALLHTVFVALQDVSREHGPTRFVPGTHSDSVAYGRFEARGDVTGLSLGDVAASPPLSYTSLLRRGEASLYDGRILHCGSANTAKASSESDGLRVMFYMTFRHASQPQTASNPAARSLLTRYDGRVSLGMLRDTAHGFSGYRSGGLK